MTVRGAVAQRQEQQQDVAKAEARLRAARDWFNTVVPKHVDGDQFIAMCIAALRRDPKLMQAATVNPAPFMVAASECARLGLVPGETYHFVPFNNRETGQVDITGIVDYKGEIDMIYRAGGVLSVHCEVVRASDRFIWRPGMELPQHEILPTDSGQIGLAGEDERGPLVGVYSYARLREGGYSQVVVMSRSEVMKHKAAAKTTKFWDGAWEPDMWRKTTIHKLYDWVPHSQEYMAERLRAESAPPIPLTLPPRQPAQIGGVPVVPGLTVGTGPAAADDTAGSEDGTSGERQGGRRRGNRGAPPPPPPDPTGRTDATGGATPDTASSRTDPRGEALRELSVMFAGPLPAPDHGARLAVCSMLGRKNPGDPPLTLETANDLTADQAVLAAHKLSLILAPPPDGVEPRPVDEVRDGLLQLARAAGWTEPQ